MPKNKPREEKKPIGERISALLARTIRFVTYDIWRITENEVSGNERTRVSNDPL